LDDHFLRQTFWRRAEAVGIFLGSFLVAAIVVREKAAVEALLASIGLLAYPLAILVFALVASAPFSVTDALAVMNGVIFGPLWGSVVNAVGIVCAAIIGYVVALRTSRLLDLEVQLQRLPTWVKRYKIGSPMFLIVVRIIPGLGGTIATQTAAAMRVPLLTHILTMSAIAIPICTALAIFGDSISGTLHDLLVKSIPGP
jgi:uncharacterized membrane protein YdjX (TVP38/TMEM64 family)